MLWLKRLTASKMKPVGAPNFKTALWRSFDLSGTELRFKNPPQTAGLFLDNWPEKIDLYGDDYEPWPDNSNMSKDVFKNGWSFKDHLLWGQGHIGGLISEIIIHRRHPHNRSITSMLKDSDARKWLYELYVNEFDDSDSDQKWSLPKSSDEIDKIMINGSDFYASRMEILPHSWLHFFKTPISDDHMLAINFHPSSWHKHLVNDLDTVSEEAEKTIEAFMSYVHIRLSPDAQKCKSRYE